jgi:hypothetical protein
LVPPLPPEPLEEKLATWSSLVDRVFIESVAPTAMT